MHVFSALFMPIFFCRQYCLPAISCAQRQTSTACERRSYAILPTPHWTQHATSPAVLLSYFECRLSRSLMQPCLAPFCNNTCTTDASVPILPAMPARQKSQCICSNTLYLPEPTHPPNIASTEINLFPRTQCTDVASEYILPGPLPEALVDSAVLMASALAPVTTPRTPHATAETWPSPSMSPSPRVLSWQPTPSPTSSPSTASLMSRSFLLAATIQSPHAMLAAAATHPLVDGPPTKTALASRKVSPLFDGYTAVLVALHAEWSCGLVTLQ